MPVATRVIACLDVDAGRVVKGVNFENLRDAGDPVELAKLYDDQGVDVQAGDDSRGDRHGTNLGQDQNWVVSRPCGTR